MKPTSPFHHNHIKLAPTLAAKLSGLFANGALLGVTGVSDALQLPTQKYPKSANTFGAPKVSSVFSQH